MTKRLSRSFGHRGRDTARGTDNEAVVQRLYQELLGRAADVGGLRRRVAMLDAGTDPLDIALEIVASEEFQHRVVRSHMVLPDLTASRPDRYRSVPKRGTVPPAEPIAVFAAEGPEDFDWLEDAILQSDYYERPGIWTLGVDDDKRLMAEMLATLGKKRALELGCASGAVIQCLDELGVHADGIEISRAAIQRAEPRIAERIHCVDLLEADLAPYDLVFGLDIFEHFNPNRLDSYLKRIVDLLADGGLLFANIPAFGPDPIFGEVFDLFLDEWHEAAGAGRNFSFLQVDDWGYPMHGHLIWATSRWWQQQLEAVGLQREADLERALHARYDAAIENISIARKSFFVFSKT